MSDRKRNFHYAWIICALCLLVQFCLLGLTTSGFSVYLPYFKKVGGFTDSQVSLIMAVRPAMSIVSMLAMNRLLKVFSAAKILMTGALLCAAGFALYGIGRTPAVCCLGAALVGIAYTFGGMLTVSLMIAYWFRTRRSFALALCSAGSGISTIAGPPILTAIIERASLYTAFFCEAAFMFLVFVLLLLLLRETPEKAGMTPYDKGKPDADTILASPEGIGPALSAAAYASAFFLGYPAGSLSGYIATLYKSVGFDSMTVAWMVSLYGGFLLFSKIAYGMISDRVGSYRATVAFAVIFLAGNVIHCMPSPAHYGRAVAGLICTGIGFPVGTVAVTGCARTLFSADQFAEKLRNMQLFVTIGLTCGSFFPGIIAQHAGGYIPAFIVSAVSIAVYMTLLIFVYKKKNAEQSIPAGN